MRDITNNYKTIIEKFKEDTKQSDYLNKLQTLMNKIDEDKKQSDLCQFVQYCIDTSQIPSSVSLCIWESNKN